MIDTDAALDRLKNADWLRLPGVQKIFAILGGAEGQTRVVGGIVRDSLLGCIGSRVEIDFATELHPEEVMSRAKAAGVGAVPTGLEFGTVTLLVAGGTYEVTTLRQDVATDGRWATVQFGTDWRADAARRDFTMNALYCGVDGVLFDPLGGLEDCLARRVRFIGDAAKRIEEDRLRVYRFFRFSASHGAENFDAEGLRAVTDAAGALGNLSAERVGSEMMRLLALRHVVKTIATMADCGVLVRREALLDRLQRYEALEDAPSAEARLALIAGDIPLKEQQKRWRLSNATIRFVGELIAAAELLAAEQIMRACYAHPKAIKQAVILAAIARNADRDWTSRIQAVISAAKVSPLPVTGQDLLDMGMPAGKGLGQILSQLEDAWIDSAFSLSRAQLLDRVKSQ